MSTTTYLCDLPSRTYVDIDKASDLWYAAIEAGARPKAPMITADFLRAFFAEHSDWPWHPDLVLRWQAEICEGRPVAMWTEHDDDRPWIDWDRTDFRREGWREVDVWSTP